MTRGGAVVVGGLARLILDHVSFMNGVALTGAAVTITDVGRTEITNAQLKMNKGDGHGLVLGSSAPMPLPMSLWMDPLTCEVDCLTNVLYISTSSLLCSILTLCCMIAYHICHHQEVCVMIDVTHTSFTFNDTIWKCQLGPKGIVPQSQSASCIHSVVHVCC
jgi:hypothetical protein